MENEHVLNGLVRKRQEIADALEAAQGRVRQLVQDIDAVDATIRIFQPEIDLDTIPRVRPIPRRHTAFRGESSRLILDMLREAGEPLATRDIVRRVMEARGLNTADRTMAETMRQRVSSSLRGLRNRQRVVSGPGRGAGVRWWLP
ncbi:MAG: hypothetical protein JO264_04835 [Acidisphaera sp.]|nr:hypothetical protein [Acidisphaera sp.]